MHAFQQNTCQPRRVKHQIRDQGEGNAEKSAVDSAESKYNIIIGQSMAHSIMTVSEVRKNAICWRGTEFSTLHFTEGAIWEEGEIYNTSINNDTHT